MADFRYGLEHRKRRARLLPLAYNTPCPFCGELMLKGEALDLDHSTPTVLDPHSKGDRIAHRHCNRSAGGRLGRARQDLRPSRSW